MTDRERQAAGEARIHQGGRRRRDGHRRRATTPGIPRMEDLPADVQGSIMEIRAIVESQEGSLWQIGDLASALINHQEQPMTQTQVVALVGTRHKSTISKARKAAEHLHDPERRKRLSIYQVYQTITATKQANLTHKGLEEMLDNVLELGIPECRIRAHFVHEAKEFANKQHQESIELPVISQASLTRCMTNKRWQTTIDAMVVEATAQLIFADPMYGQYYRCSNGQFQSGREATSPMICVSDNNSSVDGDKMVEDVFRKALPLLAEGGTLCLCQAGMATDRAGAIEIARDMGFECFDTPEWLKDQLAPREYESYGCGRERLLFLRRKGESLIDYSNKRLPMGDVLYCPSVTHRIHADIRAGRRQPGEVFYMQKPLALCEYLVLKHSRPGDLCIDLFGGSGSFSLAALKHRRRWLYFESHVQPFNLAMARLRKAVEGEWDNTLLVDYPTAPREYEFPPPVVDVRKALRLYEQAVEPQVQA